MATLIRQALMLVFAGLLFTSQAAQAQTYAYRNDVFAYDTPTAGATNVTWHASGATPACTAYPQGDDDWADVAFPGGFTFTFGGVSYSSVRVYSNGILAFPTDVSGFHRDYSAQALPITGAGTPGPTAPCTLSATPRNLMLPYWIDIIAGTAGGITGANVKYEMLGVAPARRFVITWNNVALYGDAGTRYSFQVVLYQSTPGVNGNFKFQYTNGSSTGVGATVGVQLTTTDFTQYANNQNFIDTTVGTAVLWYPANQLTGKRAEYRFDEGAWTGTAGEVKDTSGNSEHASRVGLAASVAPGLFPGGKLCRGGSFPLNTTNTVIGAVATPITPSNQGSIDFWFNSNTAWNAGGTAAMLLDATTVANRPFFLMKSASGALTFVVSDTVGATVTATAPARTYAANTWHHVGIAWNMRAGTNQTVLQIFLDGVLQNGAPTRGTTNGLMPGLSTVYVGDNRTSGVTPNGGTPRSANGSIDEVYIYAVEISAPQALADMNLTRPTCTVLDHFHIVHNGAVSSCGTPASITIEAHDSTHALFTLAGTSMNLSTTPARGTWSDIPGGAISVLNSVVAGAGTASYTFSNESTVTFGLSNNVTEALNINAASGAITEHTGTASACVVNDYTTGTTCDASRSFLCIAPFGFNCVQSTVSPVTGRLFTKLAGTAFTFKVVALKDTNADLSADAVETQYASDMDKSVTVELVEGAGTTACADRTPISPAVSQTLIFTEANQPTEQGIKDTAAMTVNKAYANLRCRVTDATATPTVVGCSSDSFSVRPSSFTVTSNATNSTATSTPVFKTGAAFSLSATAIAGYSGTPLVNASLLVGSPNAGTLTGTFPAANVLTGIATNVSFSYSEVGTLGLSTNAVFDSTFTAIDSPNDCTADFSNTETGFKYGCSFGSTAVPLASGFGRFIPDHLDTLIVQESAAPFLKPMACPSGSPLLTCPANATGANGMLYSGQDFTVQVTAKNAAGANTTNYAGSYAKAVTLSAVATNGGTAIPVAAPGGTLASSGIAATGFANGVSTVTPGIATFTFAVAPTVPTDVFVRAEDGDSVSSLRGALSVEGGIKVVSGRIKLPNVYGSERLPLSFPVTVQYFHGSAGLSWVTSATDNITSINSNLSTAGGNVVATTITGLAPGLAVVSPNVQPVTAGVRNIVLSSQGASGSASILINTPSYLSKAPGRATFGIFKSPLIYRRENY
ncbi:MAG: DUF6701 domain-containing protein [Pseudomonadota bacterium]